MESSFNGWGGSTFTFARISRVPRQQPWLGECFAAYVAAERLLSHVRPDVIVQSSRTRKGARAEPAFKWLLGSMRGHVRAQKRRIGECLAALSALIGSGPVRWTNMHLQSYPLSKRFVTLLALP